MSTLIKFDPSALKQIDHEGRIIYKNNQFMRSLVNVMENPEFLTLFKECFNSWENIETFLMFAKVYESITNKFHDMSGYEKIALVKRLIDNSKTRRLICQEVINFRTKDIKMIT